MREKDTAPNTTAMTTPTSTVSGFFTLNRENKSISPLYGNITAKSTMFLSTTIYIQLSMSTYG